MAIYRVIFNRRNNSIIRLSIEKKNKLHILIHNINQLSID